MYTDFRFLILQTFFAVTVNVFRPLAVFAKKLHRCLSTLSLEVSTTGVIQWNLELLLPPNSPDSHQTQLQ